ncbi:MAG: hypothetical protein AAF353_19530 [Pseudomonadota bacterium]
MSQDSSRSEEVVDAFKKRKLAVSAYYRMQDLVKGFEQERVGDARMAMIGVVLILAVIVVATTYFLTRDNVTLF